MPKTVALDFEPEFITAITRIFEESIVFNQTLGLKITKVGRGSYIDRETRRRIVSGEAT